MRRALAVAFACACATPLFANAQAASSTPQEVALIVEPTATAPVLYPGKPSVPLEGTVRLVAIPSFKTAAGKPIDAASLTYTWSVDNAVAIGNSGVGKNVLVAAAPLQYRTRAVSVLVETADSSRSGNASTTLVPTEPSVRIYENDPLLGIRFENALANSYAISGSEASLYAAPFSFATNTGAPRLSWFLGGALSQTGALITMRPQGTGKGSVSLSLMASGPDSITATKALSVSFGAGSSSFGL